MCVGLEEELKPVLFVPAGVSGRNGNPEETSFEDFLLENALCHWKLITWVEVLCFFCTLNRSSFL